MRIVSPFLMNRIQDKSILFFSTFDPISRQLLDKLRNFPQLLEQVELIQLNASDGTLNRYLPRAIRELIKKNPKKIPIFVPSGIGNIVYGEHAISWLDNCIHNNCGGITFGSLRPGITSSAATLDSKGKMTRRDLFTDSEFHMNAQEIKNIRDFTRQHTNVTDSCKLKLTSDRTNKKQASRDIRVKFQAMKSARIGGIQTTINRPKVDPRPVPQIPWGGQLRPATHIIPGGMVRVPKPTKKVRSRKRM